VVVVEMNGGEVIRFPVDENPRLKAGSPEQRANIELSPYGLHWPDLDEDLSIRGIRGGYFGV